MASDEGARVAGDGEEIRTRTHVLRVRTSSRGLPYSVWEPIMPTLDPEYLNCVVYLYATEDDARDGEHYGGSGFIVGVPYESQSGGGTHLYAVTNSHLIKEGHSPIIRLNTREDGFEVLSMSVESWTHHPEGDDIAVCMLGLSSQHRVAYVSMRDFLTREQIQHLALGLGDEIFMVGRFMNYEGARRNIPIPRFGHIVMMPGERIWHKRRYPVEGFLVEMHSASGYSGSPVFLAPSTIFTAQQAGRLEVRHRQGAYLLGVDWGHIPVMEYLKMPVFLTLGEKEWVNTQDEVATELNTGVSMVAPAWKLRQLLELDELRDRRREVEANAAPRRSDPPAVSDGTLGG